jgi:heterodisulfide reductase subunit A
MAGETLRKQIPDAVVYNIHDRLILAGAEQERFLKHQIKEGTQMVPCKDLANVGIAEQADGKLSVAIPGQESLLVDMVILSTGFKPGANAKRMATVLNAELDAYGFFKSDHPVLNMTGSVIDGISMAGSCVEPCHSPRSIVMAQAAVGRALSRLVPGRTIELETMVSFINPDICAGCKMCMATCPYKAIRFDYETKKSVVNEAICHGCGTCAATCPSNAIISRHFTNDQLLAEVKGVLHG